MNMENLINVYDTPEQPIDTISLVIQAGQHGGLVVYEHVGSESKLVFGGNLKEFTDYIQKRGDDLLHVVVAKDTKEKTDRKVVPVIRDAIERSL